MIIVHVLDAKPPYSGRLSPAPALVQLCWCTPHLRRQSSSAAAAALPLRHRTLQTTYSAVFAREL